MKIIMKLSAISALFLGSAMSQSTPTPGTVGPWGVWPELPAPRTDLPAPPPIDPALVTNATFIGANLNDGQLRLPTPENMEKVAAAAEAMHLKVIRVPMVINLVNTTLLDGTFLTEDLFIQRLQNTMDSLQRHNLKAILMFAGFSEYNQRCYVPAKIKYWDSYTSVQSTAVRVVTTFKDHPALFAWDILNEAIWGAFAYKCSIPETIKSVYANYEMIESIDNKTPTTMGEIPEFQPYWNNIVSYASPHAYPTIHGLTEFSSATMDTMEADIRTRLQLVKKLMGSKPTAIGEFGYQAITPTLDQWYGQAYVYQRYMKVLKEENLGGCFWDLAIDDWSPGYSLLFSNGAWMPAAYEVVRSEYQ
jgi:Cellulase (glycosyl hydrolase family 5)